MWFSAANYTHTYFWLFAAILQLGWGQDFDYPDEEDRYISSSTRTVGISGGGSPMERPTSFMIRQHQVPQRFVTSDCSAPPQPVNGEWRLHPDLCEKNNVDCKVPGGTQLNRNYELIFTCATGYRINGDNIAYCRSNGNWSSIPSCIEIECGALNSVTRIAHCSHSGKIVSCDFPVLPWTRADLSCRPGYTEVTPSTPRRNLLTCNEDGEWEPHPFRCIRGSLPQTGWGQNIANTPQMNGVNLSTNGLLPVSSLPAIGGPTLSITSAYPNPPQISSNSFKSSCPAPPQPVNGEWKIREEFCEEIHPNCKVPEGTKLEPSYELVYSCKPGYRANGDNIIYCRRNGNWSSIPSCIVIKCSPLNTVTRIADCIHSRNRVSCAVPALPTTQAELSCRPGYREDLTLLTPRRNILTCNGDGEWEPQPLRCIPVCGQAATHQKPLLIEGSNATIGDFPWHVSLYSQKSLHNPKKYFQCGATLIHTSMLLTAAHCAYDETVQRPVVPEKLFVMTGNFYRGFDDTRHDLNIVRKSTVKYVHIYYTYHGLPGNYASDIALLELEQPFVFSEILLPACLDTSGNSAPYLEPGVSGKLAGFGRTATDESSPILQTLTVPYIPHSECKTSKNAFKNQVFLTKDKFCAGYTNGSAVCEGDSGGGLVFYKNDLWYVLGVVSVGLGVDLDNGEKTCERYSYTLYTRVSEYMKWILEVIAHAEDHKSNHPRDPYLQPVPMTAAPPPTANTATADTPTEGTPTEGTPTEGTTSSNTSTMTALSTPRPTMPPTHVQDPTTSEYVAALSACLVPPQPANGQWKLDKKNCGDFSGGNMDCDISQGIELKPGSALVCRCDPGYKIRGHADVHCHHGGSWTTLPVCIEIKCSVLNSPSTNATCTTRTGDRISCDFAVPPGTRVEVACHTGYKRETSSLTTRRDSVQCNSEGKWEPEPIRCIPVCGKMITRQKPLVQDGNLAEPGEFPWHASIHLQTNTTEGSKKEFLCGATLIQDNLLLTAAHCVFDERTKTGTDPARLFVITGNFVRDYDSPLHNELMVKKRAVKNVHRHCQYYGLTGGYFSDIALLELQEPFQLTDILSPACLDYRGNSVQILDTGAFGKKAGFGLTTAGPSSGILQTSTVPYVPYNECKKSAVKVENGVFISADKFCAGYTNGSAICIGDDGGGLVFQKRELWFVLGIASVGFDVDLDKGDKTCNRYSYSIYTKVSYFIRWIQKIISELEQYKSYPSCDGSVPSRGKP